jgi:acetylornithine deacetylase
MSHPVVDLLKSLMGIVCTSGKEYDVGVFLQQHLEALGYTVERQPIAPGSDRHNVYAYLGPLRKTRVLVTAHMDTVPPHIPLSVDGDIIRGRGSSDDLGPLAAQIVAVEELRREGVLKEQGDVGLLFVVGEENGGHGMFAANELGLTWESGVFAEPTENKLAKGHKGQIAFELTAGGLAW